MQKIRFYIYLYRFLYSFALRILRGARGGIFVYRAASKKKGAPGKFFFKI